MPNDKSCLFPIKNLHISRALKYSKILGRKIFNYDSLCRNSFSLCTLACLCNDPCLRNYIDSDQNHILTGNFKIINNPQLNKLMENGIKLRLLSHSNANLIVKQLIYDLDFFIYKLYVSYNKPLAFVVVSGNVWL